ncbi:hypothetical protein VTJ04DRAFT_7342 [Mycothermus thermophilus]|uniref:uncharacterized protein n=1 Tax=Humicola insolens TaxID=85995 RepID=UPI003742E6B5
MLAPSTAIARDFASLYPLRIGYDDQFRWHPYVLRWAEFELFSRAVAAAATTATERPKQRWGTLPGLVILLLCRFAPMCTNTLHDDGDEDDAEMCKIIRMIVRACCQVLGKDQIDDETVRRFIERADFYKRKFDEGGNWNAEEWDRLLKAARMVVEQHEAAAGADPDPTADLTDQELAFRFGPREWHRYKINIPFTKRDRPLSEYVGHGGRHLGGTINGRDIKTWEQLSVSLCCNPGGWSEAVTLADTRDIAAPGESYLGIYVPTVDPKWHWHVAHTLPDSLKDMLASPGVLGDGGRLSGLTKDGWYTVTASRDGGELGFNLSRAEEEEELNGTGAVALRKVTPQVTEILHRFMEASGAVLAPVALAAKPLPKDVRRCCIRHRVVNPDELYEILSGGAYKLWLQVDKRSDEEKESGDPYASVDDEDYDSDPEW